MLNYFFENKSSYNEFLQYFTVFLLFVIGTMVYYISDETSNIITDVGNLKMECPPCPQAPGCPKCPDLKCGDETNEKEAPKPQNCPSVEDIVSGIFPGRNMGITRAGKYFDLKENDYELLSDSEYYQATNAFESDSILNPKLTDDVLSKVDNSYNTNYVNTSRDPTTLPEKFPTLGEPPLSESETENIDSNLTRMELGMNNSQSESESTTKNESDKNNATRSKEP
tara:strand:+ start:258 stop:932 length:675 start_codon:yes stop_codon:yes gene_type:complete